MVASPNGGGRIVHQRTGDSLTVSPTELMVLARATAGGLDAGDAAGQLVVRKFSDLGLLAATLAPEPRADGPAPPSIAPVVERQPLVAEKVPRFDRGVTVTPQPGTAMFEVNRAGSGKKLLLHDFEVSIARMFDGRRTPQEVLELAERLGIPLTMLTMEQFAEMLDSHQLLERVEAEAETSGRANWPGRDEWTGELRELFRSGLKKHREGDYGSAAEDFEQMLKLSPDNDEARDRLAIGRRLEPLEAVRLTAIAALSPPPELTQALPDQAQAVTIDLSGAPEEPPPEAAALAAPASAEEGLETDELVPETAPELAELAPEAGAAPAPSGDAPFEMPPPESEPAAAPAPAPQAEAGFDLALETAMEGVFEPRPAALAAQPPPEAAAAEEQIPTINIELAPTAEPSPSYTLEPAYAAATAPDAQPTPSFELEPAFAGAALAEPAPKLEESVAPSIAPARSPPVPPAIAPARSPPVPPAIAPARSPPVPPAIAPARSPPVPPAIAPAIPPSVPPSVPPAISPAVLPPVEPAGELLPPTEAAATIEPFEAANSVPPSKDEPIAPAPPPPAASSGRALALVGAGLAALALGVFAWFSLRPAVPEPEPPLVAPVKTQPVPVAQPPTQALSDAGSPPEGAVAATETPAESPRPGETPAPGGLEKPVAEKPVAEKPVAEKPVAEKPVAEKPVAERPAPAGDRPWREVKITTRGRVPMAEILAPATGKVSWSAKPNEHLQKGAPAGTLTTEAGETLTLIAGKEGLLDPKVAGGETAKKGDQLATMLYIEAFMRATIEGAEPDGSWACEVESAAAGARADCKVITTAKKGGGVVVTATTEPRWFDTAKDAVLRLAPP